ncbi:MAG TPA: hypothetical protein VIX86_25710 [Streptosporangiaceae bacterium]
MRMFRQVRWSRGCWAALGAAVSAVVFLGGTATAATGWTVVTIPQPSAATVLYGAFARTSSDVWVVGRQFGPTGQPAPPPVAYHWNGSAWSLLTMPTTPAAASVGAVSASSATDAWTVGWTGGYRHIALTEHWNGTAWSMVPGPVSSAKLFALRGVADLSPTNAYAIGSDLGVAYHWDGTAWSTFALPDASFAASAMTAVSATDIWLVGSGSAGAEAMNYNGSAWTVVPVQQPSGNAAALNGITAVAANDIWAVGDVKNASGIAVGTLTEHWNGSNWSIVPSPTASGTFPTLNAVAARSSSDVYAVGAATSSGTTQGLILRWNGSTWSQDTDPTGSGFSVLYAAAAAPGAAQEWAAGFQGNGGPDQALVLSHS